MERLTTPKFTGFLWVSTSFYHCIVLCKCDRCRVAFAALHPRHKLQYFRDAGWENDWIMTAERIIRDRFETDYCRVQPASEIQRELRDSEVRGLNLTL